MPVTVSDISDALKSGAYLLTHRDRVVFVGRSRCMLAAIAAHRAALGVKTYPSWSPIKRIPFDGVQIIPCDMTTARSIVDDLNSHHKLRTPISYLPGDPAPQPDLRRQ